MKMERRLSAILAADISGYSRLLSEDEEGTIRAVQEHQAALLPLIQKHGGHVIDTAGDSILAEFGSVVSAVHAAADSQRLIGSRNTDVPKARRVEFRIGVNQGEIVGDQQRYYGDGINVTSRRQALAEPGGIARETVLKVSCSLSQHWYACSR
jgi:adenylate cyclase